MREIVVESPQGELVDTRSASVFPLFAVKLNLQVKISYCSSPRSTAIQWLPPAQTQGGVRPYLFTQGQAIHARSLLPCQDCPSVKAS